MVIRPRLQGKELEADWIARGFEVALLKEENEKLKEEIAKLKDDLHYANGCAELAMKHRDIAERRLGIAIDLTDDNNCSAAHGTWSDRLNAEIDEILGEDSEI